MAQPWGEFMRRHKNLRATITSIIVALLSCAPACAQQRAVPQRSGSDSPARVPARPPDIISDNLDRVAASADQILEVVNKEAGLMVELKRLLAQDAGVSGQILEESDLTDVAVAERLRSDLRARVLATRLLQRYGYLVPRLNPDSDLWAEQKLVQQERAQILARAAERQDTLSGTAPHWEHATCDPRRNSQCASPSSLPEDREGVPATPAAPSRLQRSSPPLQRAEDVPQNDIGLPNGTIAPIQRAEYPANLGATETLLTSMGNGVVPPCRGAQRIPGSGTGNTLPL